MTRLRDVLMRNRPAAREEPAGDKPDRGLVTLHDSQISGWYNNQTGELFPGFPVGPDDVVVDVGCGDGGNLNFCASRGAELIGVDLDAGALTIAEEKIRAGASERTQLHAAAAEELPVADATATRVVCTEVLEHVAQPDRVMAELVRIGRPGALYLISVPDEVGETVQRHRAPAMYFEAPNHVRVFSRTDFHRSVEAAGLEVLSESRYGFFWAVWWGLFWETGVDFAAADHPILDEWTQTWCRLLETPQGVALKRKLDEVVPKTQVIVARKPALGGGGTT